MGSISISFFFLSLFDISSGRLIIILEILFSRQFLVIPQQSPFFSLSILFIFSFSFSLSLSFSFSFSSSFSSYKFGSIFFKRLIIRSQLLTPVKLLLLYCNLLYVLSMSLTKSVRLLSDFKSVSGPILFCSLSKSNKKLL